MAKKKAKRAKVSRRKPLAQPKDLNVLKHVFHELYNEGDIIIVQPPAKRVVRIDTYYENEYGDDESEDRNYYLSFPHVIFRIRYSKKNNNYHPMKIRVAFVDKANPKKLYMPPLANISCDGQVCIPVPSSAKTVTDLAKKWIADFWRTQFNESATDTLEYYHGMVLGSPKSWEKQTHRNPKWIPNGRSLLNFPSMSLSEFLEIHQPGSEEYYDEDDGY